MDFTAAPLSAPDPLPADTGAEVADRRPPGRPALSRRRKAALIVQLCIAEDSPLSLSRLPEEAQLALTRELAALGVIDRTTVENVAEEFLSQLESVGVTPPGGVEAALAALKDRISPAAAARLRAEAAAGTSDPWSMVTELSAPDLVPLMEKESTEIAAVALSKLPVPRAAELLALLPGDRARRIAFAVSQTAGISPASVARIGRALAAEYGGRPSPAFSRPPAQRVGAILDSSRTATRESVLEGLEKADPAFADGVRKAIFTFADIPARVRPTDLPQLLREMDGAALITAMAAASGAGGVEGEAAQFILSNISARMADQMRDDIAERGKPRRAEGDKAMASVIAAIRQAAELGDIQLRQPDEDEEEG